MKMKKDKSIQEAVTDFGNETTIHGLQYAINGTHILFRLCWLAICVSFLVVFIIQGVDIFKNFFGYPYSTKIDIVNRVSLPFPAVTVCNANRMRRSAVINTRFEGLIEIDGGVSGSDYDYSWWFSPDFFQGYGSSESNSTSGTPTPDGSPTSSMTTDGALRRQRRSSSDVRKDDDSYNDYGSDRARRNVLNDFSWYDSALDSDFQYDDGNWDTVTDSDDWNGFYQNSQADDYSDLTDVINPSRDELVNYGHQLTDFILQCTFDRRPCNISQHFYTWQNRYYGNCFTFNSALNGNISSTGKTGALNGLHLTLFVEQPEYIGILAPSTGAKVSIHHPDIQPFPEDDAVGLPTGHEVSIGVRQEYIERLGGKYGNCTQNGSATNFTTSANYLYAYSSASCRKNCYQLYLKDYCNCVDDPLYDGYDTKCSVLNFTQQWCRQYIEEQHIEDRLTCSCPTPCAETKYTKTISSMIWPSERYEEHLQNRLFQMGVNNNTLRVLEDSTLTRKNAIRLKVFYEELNFEQVVQFPVYTIPSLLGSVGGLMGLYIGMSFISLFEVLFLFLDIGKIVFFKLCFRTHSVRNNKSIQH